jgi:hypothetical protein
MTTTMTTREEVLERYRPMRQSIIRHLNAALKYASGKAMMDAARRIGMLHGNTIVADSESELNLASDLAVFGGRADRSRAIDRYARANQFPAGSVDASVLAAMRTSIFRIIHFRSRHVLAGINADNVFGQDELWLMDEGFEASAENGLVLAARLVDLGPFYATAGACVPMGRDILLDAVSSLVGRRQTIAPSTLDNPRLPEAIYAAAIRGGAMSSIEFAGA